ncbi:hypothetical protein [Caniella muris]|uniref:hypothetical protein n=1 Tax=Caniella muris TaxID=2941502 RepID=UPI00203E4250|nr:hypothetical protein [Caniella muris]
MGNGLSDLVRSTFQKVTGAMGGARASRGGAGDPGATVSDEDVRAVVKGAMGHARGFSAKVVAPWVVGTCFALSVVSGAFAGGAPAPEPEPADPPAPVAVAEVEEPEEDPAEPSQVTFSVAVPAEWPADGTGPAEVAVSVAGTSDEGGAVSETLSVAPGSGASLDLEPGSYVATAQSAEVTLGDTVFSAGPSSFTVDGSGDAVKVSVTFAVDTAKTEALAAEKAAAEKAAAEKAEAERKAAEQAEAERRAAEQAAAEQAAAEEARRAQEAEAQRNSQTVYITDTGKKYHNRGCRHLKESQHPIALDDAVALGYGPCKHCH